MSTAADKRHEVLNRTMGAGRAAHPHFIQGAIKHPGALHQDLGIPQGQPIPQATLAEAAHRPGVVGQRARFAETLERLRK
jgi:hypothetical protein